MGKRKSTWEQERERQRERIGRGIQSGGREREIETHRKREREREREREGGIDIISIPSSPAWHCERASLTSQGLIIPPQERSLTVPCNPHFSKTKKKT